MSVLLGLIAIALAGGLGWALLALSRAHAELAVMRDRAAQGADAVPREAAHAAQLAADAMINRAEETFKPVKETLSKFQERVDALEKARVEETGGLKAQIAALMQASVDTQAEARKLSSALRRGAGVQGRWGEQTLRNVLETAGLSRFDFSEQVSTETDEGRRRPDVTVRLPGGGVFVIDAKCSLNAFLEAQEAADEPSREAALARHAQSVRAHMTGLAQKAYWDQFKSSGSPDFVAMFVPGDSFLAAALDHAPDLMTEAMDKRVILVTPTTLFALCKAIAYGWRVEEQARNADQIAALGRDLYKRLSVMGGHVSSVGKALDAAVGRYNQFVGSLETQVLSQARKFEDLAADHEGKTMPQLESIDGGVRQLSKLAANEPAAEERPILTARVG